MSPRSRRVRSTSRPDHPREPEVEDDEVVLAAGGEPEPLEAIVHQVGMKVLLLQAPLHVLADGAVVLDDEDLHASPPGGTGKEDAEGVPPAGNALSTSIRPRCSSTMP